LLYAMVDVISSNRWLQPALAAMELCQMVTQACWNTDSPLLQLPHFTSQMLTTCKQANIESINDLMDMEDNSRLTLLKSCSLTPKQIIDIANFCNRYPDIGLTATFSNEKQVIQLVSSSGSNNSNNNKTNIVGSSSLNLSVTLQRDSEDEKDDSMGSSDDGGISMVACPRYPQAKSEGWWLIVGDPDTNEILAIKRLINLKQKTLQERLEFNAPENSGQYHYMLYLMSDSYLGVDQEFQLHFTVSSNSKSKQEHTSTTSSDTNN